MMFDFFFCHKQFIMYLNESMIIFKPKLNLYACHFIYYYYYNMENYLITNFHIQLKRLAIKFHIFLF